MTSLNSMVLSSSNGSMGVKVFIVILALFLVGAVLGYLIEVLYRRFVSVRKWVNPGFMKGPWLPMYGFGLIIMFFMTWMIVVITPDDMTFYNPIGGLFGKETVSGPCINDLLIIVIISALLILLEFIAGLIFVKGFKVRLWDYSNMKGNIMGIICPVFNLIWFSIAVIYYYGINPFVYSLFHDIFNYFYGESSSNVAHFGTIFFLGVIYGVFIIDLVKSIDLFHKVQHLAKDSGIIERYEKLREEARKTTDDAKKAFFNKLPAFLKDKKEKDKPTITEKLYEATRNALLIDPTIKGTEQNYDENGRPRKEE